VVCRRRRVLPLESLAQSGSLPAEPLLGALPERRFERTPFPIPQQLLWQQRAKCSAKV
jgi:hypothetical protein